jgi:prefoldin subunit 5
MTIALGILVLKNIGKAVALIQHDCDALAGDLEELGNKIVENLEDANIR